MIINGSNVTVMVANLDRAIQFYEKIGLSLKQRWDNHYAMMVTEGVTVGLHPGDGAASFGSGSVSIGFMVAHIAVAKDLLDSHHIAYTEEAGKSGHYLHFHDQDRTALYFVQPAWLEWS